MALLATTTLVSGPEQLCPCVAEPAPSEVARVEFLENALQKQADELAALRAELDGYRAWMSTVAIPIHNQPAPRKSLANLAPSSGLDRDSATRAAMAARLMVTGAGALNVLPTGSMRPTFDQNAILLTEPARFEDIRVGDIVTFKHPAYLVSVVHRVLEKRGDRFWSKGDANGRMDDIYITRENFDRRVFGIIYGRESAITPLAR
ncbi:MAG TPA: signal peptidase I [Opitutaceae bacterium]|nr:signal peptidase I [Opitutaceae bacterium]